MSATPAEELRAIIARVEAATGPDRRLDGEIWRAVSPEGDWHLDGNDMWMRRCPDDGVAFDLPAEYSASLDAAASLVPSGWEWATYKQTDRISSAHVGDWRPVNGPTPALALTAAALRARLAMMPTLED